MLTVFNRKLLTTTYSMKEQGRIREELSANHIDYYVKTVNRKSASPFDGTMRARTGTFGEDLSKAYEYSIYVHKNDYEKAKHLLHI